MKEKKNIVVIIGSASQNSTNQKLIDFLIKLDGGNFEYTVCDDLKTMPPFSPEQSVNDVPNQILELRNTIEKADGVLICTPEYIFSIPSGLKNVLEWSVATTIFSNKPTGLITASASGIKGHEQLLLIMKTVMAHYTEETTLLIQGVKGKINAEGEITDKKTKDDLITFFNAFKALVNNF